MDEQREPDNEHLDDSGDTGEEPKWLDELAGGPTSVWGKESESKPHELTEKDENLADDDIPDWLTGELSEQMPTEEAVPEWLRAEMVSGEIPISNEIAADSTQDEEEFKTTLDASADETRLDEGVPGWLQDEVSSAENAVNDRAEYDELGWLDQIAAGEGAAIEEPPTLSWDEGESEPPMVVDKTTESEMAWLDDVNNVDDITSATEPESLLREAILSEIQPEMNLSGEEFEEELQKVESFLGESPEDVPEDPDEAMAWLEQLAARQGAPAEELPALAEQYETLGDLDAGEMPEDPDEAMAWLEQLAAQQKTSLEELDTTIKEEDFEQEYEYVDTGPDEELDLILASLGDVQMPEDLDQAMMWMEELVVETDLGDESQHRPETILVVEEQHTPTAHDLEEALSELKPISDQLIDEDQVDYGVEEDAEETVDALAWLEQLAARQGAPAEELTHGESGDAEAEMPEWLRQEVEQVEIESLAEPQLEEMSEELAEVEDISPLETLGAQDLRETTIIASIEEEVELDLTKMDQLDEADEEDLAWLETLGSVDADKWLEAEATAGRLELSESLPELETEMEEIIEDRSLVDIESDNSLDVTGDIHTGTLDRQRLAVARRAMQESDLALAVNQYSALLENDQGLPYLIAELESSVDNYGEQPMILRLLGDAYVNNGQLKKAVEVYRKALDNL